MEQLDCIKKSDITELKAYNNPPIVVKVVLEALAVLMHTKTDWVSCKKMVSDPNFIMNLKQYNKDEIAEDKIRKVS